MAKKKARVPGQAPLEREAARAAQPVPADAAEEAPCRWPEILGPWPKAVFLAGAAAALAVMVFAAASLGGFTALKIALAALLGTGSPDQVSPANFDIASVAWGLSAVVLTGLIHPVLGIGLVLLGRSWLDGYTFPLDNIYFTWSIYLLCVLWLLRVLRKQDTFRMPPPVVIMAAVVFWLFATASFSIQYYATYQMLWLWLGYGVLFVMCLNITCDRRVSGILLAIFLAALGLQAAFSILHFEFLLPFLRKAVMNPAILRRYFNTDVISPEMARRFMVNRAFGTLLFPNALAAYLLLGLPFVLFMLAPFGRACLDVFMRGQVRRSAPDSAAERVIMMALAVGLGLSVFIGIQAIAHFPLEYRDKSAAPPLFLQTVPLIALSLAGGCATGIGMLYLLMRRGLRQWAVIMRFAAAALLAPVLTYTLWITYSRGAYIAFLAALVWAAVLYTLKPRHLHRMSSALPWRRAAACLAALLLLACVSALLIPAGSPGVSWAQDAVGAPAPAPAPPPAPAAPGAPRPIVREEGIDLSMNDLVNPASFRLRLGYWRVALNMALHNLPTGVGLGNFAISYPRYQYLGAGDVREAHNGFLQFFSETGLIGGTLFLAFWAWLALWGAARIIREEDRHEKLFLLGMYTGLAAFCLHAVVDINFSHPSLMMFAMAWAGLFCGRAMAVSAGTAPGEEDAAPPPRGRRAIALSAVLLVLAAAAFAGSARIYLQQLALNGMRFVNLSSEEELNRHMRAGMFFFKEVPRYAQLRDAGTPPKEMPRLPLSMALLVVDDLDTLAAGSAFYRPIPDAPGRFARIEKGDPVPGNALAAVYKPWLMRKAAVKSAWKWVQELEAQDQRFPHWPILAMHLAKWYELYAFTVFGPEFDAERPGWISKYVQWSEIMVRRNPCHADMRMFYGNALMWEALEAPGADVSALIAKADAEFREMIRLSPISPQHRYAYAGALNRMAAYYREQGQNELAASFQEKEGNLAREASELEAERHKSGLYP